MLFLDEGFVSNFVATVVREEPYMKKKLGIPKFKNEEDERAFWAEADLTDYVEPEDFQSVSFPNLKPSSTLVL